MMSLRSFARAAPRTFSRIAAQSARPALRNQVVNAPWKQAASARLTSAFSTSAWRSQVNEELVAKLQSEIDIENSMRNEDEYSSNIKEFKESSAFEIKDTPGQEEVVLTRKFNDETVTVTFTIADLANMDQEQEPDEYNDEALSNEGESSRNSAADEYAEDAEESRETESSFPARVSVKIERPGKGALFVEALAQDGEFTFDSVLYFPDAELAEPKTAEKEWERRALYTGPQFGSLDEDLQLLLEKYLEERGINTRMAIFIPDYIDFKEQKEYMRWLANVKNFVE